MQDLLVPLSAPEAGKMAAFYHVRRLAVGRVDCSGLHLRWPASSTKRPC